MSADDLLDEVTAIGIGYAEGFTQVSGPEFDMGPYVPCFDGGVFLVTPDVATVHLRDTDGLRGCQMSIDAIQLSEHGEIPPREATR